ncbi:MAG: M20 family metallopeptidase [Halobacteriales archaeon]
MAAVPRHEELESLLADLVSIETENPPGNEAPCAEYIQEWFSDRGIDAELIGDPYEDRPQVAAQVGSGDPTVVLNGHIDVVPAGDRDEWAYDPYGGTIEDGKLYGRGSADMKGGVAVAMMAAAELQEPLESGDIDGSIVVHAAIGEETAEPGTKRLLELGYDGDYGVVLEPTELRTATSEKGLAWYEITIEGDPSHASRPDQGSNAILNARPVLDALIEYDARVRQREDELVGQAYSTVTMFEAGTKENVVPERATITIDRRFLPAESTEEIDAEIDALLSDIEDEHDIEIEWERTRTYESAEIPVDSELAETLRDHSEDIADISRDPWGIQASTDVRNFVNDADIEAVTWGPGPLDQAHTFDEHTDLAQAGTGLRVLKRAVRELLD